MAFALPINLTGALTEREAIADAIHRGVLAFDLNDEALLLSAITEDMAFEMPGTSSSGIQELKAAVFDRVAKLDTTHIVSNMRISIESATTAKATCSVMAQHVRAGQGLEPGSNKYLAGGFYLCEMVKVGDLWKVKSWKVNIVWVNGDPTVMTGE